MTKGDWLISAEHARRALPPAPARQWVRLMENGSMHAGLYAPPDHDDQTPHDQDEVYVVLSGSGTFVRDGERRAFGPGDLIFVPAGMPHRFEDFTKEFAVWVVFYGPKGGES